MAHYNTVTLILILTYLLSVSNNNVSG